MTNRVSRDVRAISRIVSVHMRDGGHRVLSGIVLSSGMVESRITRFGNNRRVFTRPRYELLIGILCSRIIIANRILLSHIAGGKLRLVIGIVLRIVMSVVMLNNRNIGIRLRVLIGMLLSRTMSLRQ
jgi:hypothetical protein